MKILSVVIVNYNVCYFLEQALLSVRKACAGLEAEVFVVDNNSVDGSADMVRKRFPEVILIENKVNTGFSRANNQAIALATGKYVLLLNPDTVVEEDTFRKCADFMDARPDAGGLGVMMLDGKGKFLPESKRGLPTPWVAFCKIFGLSSLFPNSPKFGRYHLSYLDKQQTHEIEILSGAFMWMRRETLEKTGNLDEDYFMYGEDIDLSYRILLAGYKNYYYPGTRIIHYKGESTKRTSVNYVFVFYRAMAIFARKHFGAGKAGAFDILIRFAIFIRAGIALGVRAIRKSILPLVDSALIYTGMYFLKSYWETNHKHVPGLYPPDFMEIVVPAYIIVWLGSAWFSGGYDKPVNAGRIARGTLAGTVLISAITNFFDNWRFSKALILLGGAWSTFILIALRLAIHFYRYRNFALGENPEKRIAIVGEPDECARVLKLLEGSGQKFVLAGFVSPETDKQGNDEYLGRAGQLNEICDIYSIQEVIFCARDMAAHEIIELMTHSGKRVPDYKIVPDDSNYVIGSSSRNAQGDFYTLNVELAILRRDNVRNKRFADLMLSLVFLAVYPVLLWFVKKPGGFLLNIFRVIFGRRSWVGFADPQALDLPGVKAGVLTPASGSRHVIADKATLNRLDRLYAKEYSVNTDLEIISGAYGKLGN
ncbi:MAG: glycosyltransferase family 2 protein [Bacteroidota bacterium]